MWILPKQLHTSPFVPDTEALISDSDEFSQLCAQSLTQRGKDSAARTWSAKLKRDSWMQHLYGRTLKPSHGPSFVTAWTSALSVIRASHSARPASDSEQKIPDTSGHLLQPELLQCDQVSVSPRMSKDISALGYPTCCKTWSDWVTERRGAYSARVKSARRTSASGSSSWPTMGTTQAHISGQGSSTIEEVAKQRTFHLKQRTNKHGEIVARGGGKTHQATLASAVVGVQNWPTANARDWKDSITGTHPPSRPNMSAQTLGQAVSVVHGQAAPASSSSLGSRQGLLVDWRTPQAQEAGAKVETLFTKDGAPAMPGQRAYRKTPSGKLVLQSQTINQQVEMMQRQELWLTPRANEPDSDPNFAARNADQGAHCHGTLSSQAKQLRPTITAHTPDMESNGPNGHSGTYLAGAVKHWGIPTARDHKSGRGNEDRQYKELTPMVERQQSGKLNPRWVETLMGLPIGWTMPSCTSPVTIAPTSCDSSEMEWFHKLASGRSECSSENWPTASMSMTAGYSERSKCNSSKKAGHVGNELLRRVIQHTNS